MPRIDVTTDAIPTEIRSIENWILWREGQRDGKPTKIPTKPYRTSGDINCDVTNPSQRRDFDTAWNSFTDSRVTADGLGFVFTDDISITGVDLDKCRDPDNAEIEDWAQDIIDRLDSYTELSPSGTGLHILVGGALPPGGNRKGHVEMYDSDRYFTVTGAHLDGTSAKIRTCQDELDAVHAEYIRGETGSDGQLSLAASTSTNSSESRAIRGDRQATEAPGRQSVSSLRDRYGDAYRTIRDPAIKEAIERVKTEYLPPVCPSTFADLAGPGVELSDGEIVKRMYDSKGGDRRRRLYEGDSSMWGSPDADYPSQSEADMALAHTLAFWTGKDPDRMDALFRNSGLMREKWDRRHYASGATYGAVAIARALLRVDDYYELPSEEGVRFSKADGPTRSADEGNGPTGPSMKWTDPTREFTGEPGNGGGSDTPTVDIVSGLDDDQSEAAAQPASSQEPQEAAGDAGASPTNDGESSPPEPAPSDSDPLHANGRSGEPVDADILTDLADDTATATGHDVSAASSTTTPDATPNTTTAGDDGVSSSETEAGQTRTATMSTTTDTEPAAPTGTDTNPDLNASTQRMMAESVQAAGPKWSRTNTGLDDPEKHPTDWTVGPIKGRTPTAQAMKVAREDNRVLARYQTRLEERLSDLADVEDERDRYKFTAETYLKAMDELMGERERYRTQLRRAGLLSPEDADLPEDPVKHLKRILRPMVRREDVMTAKETLSGLDAVLREYEEANERIQAEERERRQQGGLFSRLFR
ncbi:MAG: hypothetical protein ACI8XM_000306 [Haloarculaceae archaeon]|jgi:hypothetical protein